MKIKFTSDNTIKNHLALHKELRDASMLSYYQMDHIPRSFINCRYSRSTGEYSVSDNILYETLTLAEVVKGFETGLEIRDFEVYFEVDNNDASDYPGDEMIASNAGTSIIKRDSVDNQGLLNLINDDKVTIFTKALFDERSTSQDYADEYDSGVHDVAFNFHVRHLRAEDVYFNETTKLEFLTMRKGSNLGTDWNLRAYVHNFFQGVGNYALYYDAPMAYYEWINLPTVDHPSNPDPTSPLNEATKDYIKGKFETHMKITNRKNLIL